MPRDGNGNYERATSNSSGIEAWQDQAAIDPIIYASEHDTHDQDIADALSASLAKDGQTVPTANLPMGGYIHTGVGNASARTHYATVSQIQDVSYIYAGATSGTSTAYTASCSPAIPALVDGMIIGVKFHTANGNAPTLNLNGLGAKKIKTPAKTDIVADTYATNAIGYFIYNSSTGVFEPLFAQSKTSIDTIATLSVTDNSTLSGTLAVTGATTLSGTLAVTGAATLSSTLAVTGNSTLSGTLTVTGDSTFNNDVTVNSSKTLTATNIITSDISRAGTIGIGPKSGSQGLYLKSNGAKVAVITQGGPSRIEPDLDNNLVIGSSSKVLQGIHTYGVSGGGGAALTFLAASSQGLSLCTNANTNPKVRINSGGGMDIMLSPGFTTEAIKLQENGIIDFRGTMGSSTKNPAVDAPADWVQVGIAGTTYYIPVYTAS